MDRIKDDYRTASLDPATRALLDACIIQTVMPWKMSQQIVDALREHEFEDDAIHDAFQVSGYFNYINRVCDSLGVDHEDFMTAVDSTWYRNPTYYLEPGDG